ncbi:MAG: alpha-2-macroglobulin family protein, partial [Bacteroidota bacterium]|nr:alpha-2-macroglobulin family protein [Bacteroidota bacterium]
MLLSIRLAFLLLITAPVMFLTTALIDGTIPTSSVRYHMSGDYEEQWKAVDKALNEGLPKTALELVEVIYARAKKEENSPQLIRAITYRVALRAVTNEEDAVVLLRDLETEVAQSAQPVRAILTSMLADMYWNYYQQNRWIINDRTQMETMPEGDFRTWDATVFFDTTAALYLRSLEAAEKLQELQAAEWQTILHGGSNSAAYRPTMFDILAHRALEFFQNDEVDLPSPQEDFEVTGLDMLAPLERFLMKDITSPNPDNPRYRALLFYQRLLRFHRGTGNATALVDCDLLRLDFAKSITWHEEKDTTYFKAVRSLHDAHIDAPISAQAGFYLARYHHEHGDFVAALKRCREEIRRHPDARGATNCRALEAGILQKEVQLAVEESTRPDTPILLSAGFRNVAEVHFRIVPIGSEEVLSPRRNHRQRTDFLADYLNRRSVAAWSQALPDAGDYKMHRTDLRAPALPAGTYMLLMSHEANFSLTDNAIAYAVVQVTRLSMQSFQDAGGDQLFWVTDAVDGAPLADLQVEMFTQRWRSRDNSYELTREGSLQTDENGKFLLEAGRQREGVMFRISRGMDTLAIGQSFHAWQHGGERTQRRTLFFTDRAIYRPGQTVHVKGIVLEGNAEKADFQVVPDVASTLAFYDANQQKIHEMQVRSNAFGSFNTVFTVPSGVLTGMMSIRNDWGSVELRVEEYKRPKFEVEFEPVKGTYALNDIVRATGVAKAYAGSNIDGAEVSWRVLRRTRYPYWYWWWRPAPRSADREIAHGTALTDDDGRFELSFEAIPDRSVDPATLPVFTYEISADVVDINGETHSATTRVSAGYTSIELSLSLPETLNADEPHTAALRTQNLGGQPIAADGTVVLERLDAPDRIFRQRVLPKPDTWVLSADEFRRDFPHDVYKDENIPGTWAVAERVLKTVVRTDEDGTDSLRLENLDPGRYRLTFTVQDASGEELRLVRDLTVYRPEAELPVPMAEFFFAEKTTVEPGGSARFLYGSGYDLVYALYRVDFRGNAEKEEWLSLSAGQHAFALPVEEKHRGGFAASVYFVRHYRLYQKSVRIDVPWSNKELTLETATFRDKLRPGQQEEWKITIKGPARDRVAAEVLASMYDASLDAIHTSSWPRFTWPNFARYLNVSEHNFGAASAQLYTDGWNRHVSYHHQSYDVLNLWLLGQRGRYYGRQMFKSGRVQEGMHMSMTMDAAAPPAAVAEMEADGLGRAEKKQMVLDEELELGDDAASSQGGDDGGLDMVKARTNFNETAFFYPDLMTDEEGNVVLRFTIPEALTRWKLRLFAHTPDLKTGYLERETVTQKELMVMPNMPRFLRESDRVVLMTKISNLSEAALEGEATLKLFDAVSMQPVDASFELGNAQRSFAMDAGRSTTVRWEIRVPEGAGPVVYRVVARAGDFSDGEEMALPVLPN